jgi:hypothetical protein
MPNRRPQLKIFAPSASPEEAAAVIAAVEQFLRDTTPPLAPEPPAQNPWLRTALLEQTGREPDGIGGTAYSWGDSHPWG